MYKVYLDTRSKFYFIIRNGWFYDDKLEGPEYIEKSLEVTINDAAKYTNALEQVYVTKRRSKALKFIKAHKLLES